eukprot:9494294-Pyramimonas_sp.AAC.3
MEVSVFYCFDILGQVGGNIHIFSPSAALPHLGDGGPAAGGARVGEEESEGAGAIMEAEVAGPIEYDDHPADSPGGGGEADEREPPAHARPIRDVLREGGDERPRAKRRRRQ